MDYNLDDLMKLIQQPLSETKEAEEVVEEEEIEIEEEEIVEVEVIEANSANPTQEEEARSADEQTIAEVFPPEEDNHKSKEITDQDVVEYFRLTDIEEIKNLQTPLTAQERAAILLESESQVYLMYFNPDGSRKPIQEADEMVSNHILDMERKSEKFRIMTMGARSGRHKGRKEGLASITDEDRADFLRIAQNKKPKKHPDDQPKSKVRKARKTAEETLREMLAAKGISGANIDGLLKSIKGD